MKKIALITVCSLALAGAAFAQGSVNWNAISFAYMTAQTNSAAYSPLYSGAGTPSGGSVGATAAGSTGFYYELLYTSFSGSQVAQPNSFAALTSWQDTGLSAANATASAGRLVNLNPNNAATVPWNTGTTQSVMMVGWSANLGTQWSQVLATLQSPGSLSGVSGNAFFGMSTTGYINPLANGVAPGASVFGNAPSINGLPINSLNTQLYLVPTAPVPEPGTMALAALGGASLLLFRRRK